MKKKAKVKKPSGPKILGVDIFVWYSGTVAEIVKNLSKISTKVKPLKLSALTNRGTKVWPGETPGIQMTDVYTCRFLATKGAASKDIIKVISSVESCGFNWVHVEKLFEMNGKPGFSSIQED